MNFRRWTVSLLAAAGLAIMSAWGAHAQQPGNGGMSDDEWTEFSCIYSELMLLEDDAYFAVVDSYVFELTEGDLYEDAVTAIMPAVEGCADDYGWLAEHQEIAMTMAIAGTVADAIEGWFIDEGYSDEEIDDIIGLVDVISDEEVFVFLTEDWRRDDEFVAGIELQLKTVGLDGDTGMVDMGMVLLETYLIGMFQAERWMDLTAS
jgi:hypothetical protein